MRELRKKIGSQVLYIPVHLQPFYRKKNLQKTNLSKMLSIITINV